MFLAPHAGIIDPNRHVGHEDNPLSIRADGKYLFCDGPDCQARTLAPVALQTLLPPDSQAHSTRGWLFVHEDEGIRHYCPRCAPRFLDALANSDSRCTPDAGEETR
jgi:hypothetical protein